MKGLPLVNGTLDIVTPFARVLFGSGGRTLPVGLDVKSVMIELVEMVTLEYSKLLIFRLESLYTKS